MIPRFFGFLTIFLASTGAATSARADSANPPRAWIKPADLDRARENIARHAWARKQYEAERSSAYHMAKLGPEHARALVPDKTPLVTTRCPACAAGPWFWSELIEDGAAVRCNSCNERFAWDPEDTTEDWDVQGVIRAQRVTSIAGAIPSLALVARLDDSASCAATAAAAVERFAEVFKNYRINKVNYNVWCENGPYFGKINGWKHHDGYVVSSMLRAYDLLRGSGVFSDEQIETIDRDLVAYSRDYFLEGYGPKGPLQLETMIQDQGYVWASLASAAAILQDEETLRLMVGVFETMLDPAKGIFQEDGSFYQNTSGYNMMLLNASFGLPDIIEGNITPGIFGNPRCALLERAYMWFLDATFPDGSIIATNDAHVGDKLHPHLAEVAAYQYDNQKAQRYLKDTWGEELKEGTQYSLFHRPPDFAGDGGREGSGEAYGVGSVHLPGIGLMILRHGEDKEGQTMAFIDYGPLEPMHHKHVDYLNLGLWSHGIEMIGEFGYPWNPEWARLWGRSARSHHGVVEAMDQAEKGLPLLWCITPGPKIAEAGLPPANSRLIALLPRARGEPVLLDLYRIDSGEESYRWIVRGRSPEMKVEGVGEWESVTVEEPLKDGRRAASADDALRARWTFDPAASVHLDLAALAPAGGTITTAAAPPEEDVINETHRKGGGRIEGTDLPTRGWLQIESPGPAATFAAALAPNRADEPAPQLRRLDATGSALALEVVSGDDRWLLLHDPRAATSRCGDLELDGRLALAHWRDGELESLTLAGGRRAALGDAEVTAGPDGNASLSRRQGSL